PTTEMCEITRGRFRQSWQRCFEGRIQNHIAARFVRSPHQRGDDVLGLARGDLKTSVNNLALTKNSCAVIPKKGRTRQKRSIRIGKESQNRTERDGTTRSGNTVLLSFSPSETVTVIGATPVCPRAGTKVSVRVAPPPT